MDNIIEKVTDQYEQHPVTKKIERVAAYVRVSTQEQKLHGLSLDAQKMKLKEYAKKHNMKIVGWYIDEGVSGRKLIRKRPELQRMIKDAEKGLFDRIIFIKLDRFFRSVAEYHECMKRIHPVVWTTTEEEYDLTTANGRMLVNMKLTIAEMEADQTGERIDLVNEYKVQTGQPLTGSTPFYYMISTDENTGRKKWVKNPDFIELTNDMIQYFLLHQNKRKTLYYINDKYGTEFEYKTMTEALKNPLLCGEYRGNPNYIEEPYVSKETFDMIQKIMSRNIPRPKSDRVYLFTGLIRCPECGRLLNSGITNQYYKSGKVVYNIYKCNYAVLQRKCCFNKNIYEVTVEKLLINNISSLIKDAKAVNIEVSEKEMKKAKPDTKKIQQQIDRLNYSWRTGKIETVEEYERDFAELKAKLDAAKEEAPEEVKDFTALEEAFSGDWLEIYNMLDAEHRRAFWRKYIESIEIDWSVAGKGNKRISKVNFFNQ